MSETKKSPRKKAGCFKWFVLAGLGLVAIVGAMALFGICPPEGPWPTPPWCAAGNGNYGGFWSVVTQGKCPPPGPWPRAPWCEDPALIAKNGESTIATFWVSIPYNLTVNEVSLVINGGDDKPMDKVGELSYQTTVDVSGGEELTYSYLLDQKPVSTTYRITIVKKDQHIYDAVRGNLEVKPTLGIFMHDTWGRNYNFTWMEDTHDHVETAFSRVAATGVQEVFVTDMHMAVWDSGEFALDNLDYHIEGEVFINDQRDEEMDQEDLNRLASAAHEEGLKIGWSTHFTFVNFGEYIGHNIPELDAKDGALVGGEKSEEWVRDFMAKWKAFLLDQAASLETAGFDIMLIHPGYHYPNFSPYNEIADDAWVDIIKDLRQVFSGEIGIVAYGDFRDYGKNPELWLKTHKSYYELDRVFILLASFSEPWDAEFKPEGTSFANIKASYQNYLDEVMQSAQDANYSPSLFVMVESSEDFLSQGFAGNKYNPQDATKYIQRDWQYQADCYEAVMQIAAEKDVFKDIVFTQYGWDDAMDPENAFWPISLSATARNKPAEAVIKKWANPLR